jgi:hypothetical protein
MDPDPDPSIFIIDLQDANKQLIFKKKFSCILLFEGTYTSFFKDKRSYYICLMIEGYGCGSRRPKKRVDPDPQHWF